MSLFVKWLESLYLEVKVTDRCLRMKNVHSTCNQCVQACKQEALSIHDHVVRINADKCNLCGACMVMCPFSAVEGMPENRKFKDGSLLYDDSFTPSVKELLIYKKRGISSILAGPYEPNAEWKKVLDRTNELLLMLHEDPILMKKTETKSISRRLFFQEAQKQGQQLARSMAPAAWKVNGTDWVLSKYYPDHQFYDVDLELEKCCLCRACLSVCPQEVFSIIDNSFCINSSRCVNCHLCTDVCSNNTLMIHPKVSERSDKTIPFKEQVCRECGKSFFTFQEEQETCIICSERDPSWLKP